MPNGPQIPAPAHILADSMLSRHFGRETVNYFSSEDTLCGLIVLLVVYSTDTCRFASKPSLILAL